MIDAPELDHCRLQKHSYNVQEQTAEEASLQGHGGGEVPRLNVVVVACQGGRSGKHVLVHSRWCHRSGAPPCLNKIKLFKH